MKGCSRHWKFCKYIIKLSFSLKSFWDSSHTNSTLVAVLAALLCLIFCIIN